MVAGDPEKISKIERLKNGIPLSMNTVEQINNLIRINNLNDELIIK